MGFLGKKFLITILIVSGLFCQEICYGRKGGASGGGGARSSGGGRSSGGARSSGAVGKSASSSRSVSTARSVSSSRSVSSVRSSAPARVNVSSARSARAISAPKSSVASVRSGSSLARVRSTSQASQSRIQSASTAHSPAQARIQRAQKVSQATAAQKAASSKASVPASKIAAPKAATAGTASKTAAATAKTTGTTKPLSVTKDSVIKPATSSKAAPTTTAGVTTLAKAGVVATSAGVVVGVSPAGSRVLCSPRANVVILGSYRSYGCHGFGSCWYYPRFGFWYYEPFGCWWYPWFGCWYYPSYYWWWYPHYGFSCYYAPTDYVVVQGRQMRRLIIENESRKDLYFAIYCRGIGGGFERVESPRRIHRLDRIKLHVAQGSGRVVITTRKKRDLGRLLSDNQAAQFRVIELDDASDVKRVGDYQPVQEAPFEEDDQRKLDEFKRQRGQQKLQDLEGEIKRQDVNAAPENPVN
jgi:hypothetical protein